MVAFPVCYQLAGKMQRWEYSTTSADAGCRSRRSKAECAARIFRNIPRLAVWPGMVFTGGNEPLPDMKMNTPPNDNFSHLDNFGLSLRNESDMVKSMDKKKTVLVAVTGTSPSVLTETVWALYKEKPDYLPEEIHVCSTSTGADKVSELLATQTKGGNTVWLDLKKAVGKEMHIKYHRFENPVDGSLLSDIQDSADQKLVADQLLQVVRSLKDPMQEECRIVCSIAGGRKSMSALMYAVMSLAGDGGDIITHVLVDERVTTCPDFFYPGQVKQKLKNREGDAITATEVHVELAEIPFVPLRSLVGDKQLGKAKGTFATLVKRARNELDSVKPEGISIRLGTKDTVAEINGEPLRLPPDPYLLLSIMVRSRMLNEEKGTPPKPLTFARCRKMYMLIVEEGLMPKVLIDRKDRATWACMSESERKKANTNEAVKKRMASLCANSEPKQFHEDLISRENEGTAVMPGSIAKEKFNLKKALEDAGLSAVVEDALAGRQIGFFRICDVGYDRTLTAPQDSPAPAQKPKAAAKKKK